MPSIVQSIFSVLRFGALGLVTLSAGSSAATPSGSPSKAGEVRLYAMDCGRAEFRDFRLVSDTGEYDGRPAEITDPCFLIQDSKGWLLWDAGLPEHPPGSDPKAVAADPMGFRAQAGPPIVKQLAALGLTPRDITYLAFSHLHFDHVGNANRFTTSTWILNRDELAWALATPAHVSMMPELFSAYRTVKTEMIDGDHDVFGDGRVRILKTPGHTPGSSALLVMLASRPVILSGDLYVTLEGREKREVPVVNENRADTLASMDRIERLARRLHARVIVQHAPEAIAGLPKFPKPLE